MINAIEVEGLGKQFRIGELRERQDTLRDTLMEMAMTPLRGIRGLVRPEAPPTDNDERYIWALRDVSFSVKQGDVVGIIGRNGAGKSTLLKVLSRITEPTTGRVRIRGRIGSLLEVGTGFHPELTGRENVFLNGAILGMHRGEIEAKFDEIVAFSGVEKFIDTPVKRYSSGMRLRLAFSVAAHLEPEILLIDEVLAVGDVEFQRRCIGKMGGVAGARRTVLFVSHNLTSVKQLCHTVYWLDGGQIREVGPADDVVDHYETVALQAFHADESIQSTYRSDELGIEVSDVTATMEDSALVVKMRGSTLRPVPRIGVRLQLDTLRGTTIIRLNPDIAHSVMENLDGFWHVTYRFDNITNHLAGGDYMVHMGLRIPSIIETTLHIKQAALVHIPSIDVYGHGLPFALERNGPVPLPFTFDYQRGE